jgi:hypothetical protein
MLMALILGLETPSIDLLLSWSTFAASSGILLLLLEPPIFSHICQSSHANVLIAITLSELQAYFSSMMSHLEDKNEEEKEEPSLERSMSIDKVGLWSY